jgi:hypothetical protein
MGVRVQLHASAALGLLSVRDHLPIEYEAGLSGVSRGVGGVQTLPKFRIFDKAEPNFQFRGKYILNNLIRIRVSLICKLSGTPD